MVFLICFGVRHVFDPYLTHVFAICKQSIPEMLPCSGVSKLGRDFPMLSDVLMGMCGGHGNILPGAESADGCHPILLMYFEWGIGHVRNIRLQHLTRTTILSARVLSVPVPSTACMQLDSFCSS